MVSTVDDIRDLRYALEVARCHSFSTAASNLAVSPAALSKAVARLERSLGVSLFYRNSRAVQLSTEGAGLIAQISGAFENIDLSLVNLRDMRKEPAGTVHVSTFTVFGRTRLAPLLPLFFERFPLISVSVTFHDGQPGLTRQAFDVRITWGERLDNDKIAHVLCDLPIALVASPDYLSRHPPIATPADLQNHACILVELASGVHPRWTFQRRPDAAATAGPARYSFAPKGRLTVRGELQTVADAARHGLGPTLIDETVVREHLRDGSLVRILPDYQVEMGDKLQHQAVMQYRREPQLTQAARTFVDFLMDEVPRLDALDGKVPA